MSKSIGLANAERVIAGACGSEEYARKVKYLLSIAPVSPADFFRRWLFAYVSVHVDHLEAVRSYEALKDLDWLNNPARLREVLHNGCENRVLAFAAAFWREPKRFYGKRGQSWADYRDWLREHVPGLGLARTSLVLELVWPTQAKVVYLDGSLLQLYGRSGACELPTAAYCELERHWVTTCRQYQLAPAVVGAMYRGTLTTQQNSVNLTSIFEKRREGLLDKLAKILCNGNPKGES